MESINQKRKRIDELNKELTNILYDNEKKQKVFEIIDQDIKEQEDKIRLEDKAKKEAEDKAKKDRVEILNEYIKSYNNINTEIKNWIEKKNSRIDSLNNTIHNKNRYSITDNYNNKIYGHKYYIGICDKNIGECRSKRSAISQTIEELKINLF